MFYLGHLAALGGQYHEEIWEMAQKSVRKIYLVWFFRDGKIISIYPRVYGTQASPEISFSFHLPSTVRSLWILLPTQHPACVWGIWRPNPPNFCRQLQPDGRPEKKENIISDHNDYIWRAQGKDNRCHTFLVLSKLNFKLLKLSRSLIKQFLSWFYGYWCSLFYYLGY